MTRPHISASESRTPGSNASSRVTIRITLLIGLFVMALVTMGSSSCVVVEEGPPMYEEPGVDIVPQNNAERMEEQEIEVMDDENL